MASRSFSRNEMRSFPVAVTVNVVSCHDGADSPAPLRWMVPSFVLFQKTSKRFVAADAPGAR